MTKKQEQIENAKRIIKDPNVGQSVKDYYKEQLKKLGAK